MPDAVSKRAAWLALAFTLVSSAEGLVTYAYRDPVGIPTICFGHTTGVKLGQTATPADCSALLDTDLVRYGAMVDKEITVPLNANQKAALVSFTYNVGEAKLHGSTLRKKFNARQYMAGCTELLKWVYAKGIKFPGLETRRQQEYELCLTPP